MVHIAGQFGVQLGEVVYQAELERGIVQQQRVVLAVDMHELFTEFTKLFQTHGGVVNESTRPATRIQLSAQEHRRLIGDLMLLAPTLQPELPHIHLKFDHAAFARIARHAGIRPLAHGQRERSDQDALPASRLAGDGREPFPEVEFQGIDKQVVRDRYPAQHG